MTTRKLTGHAIAESATTYVGRTGEIFYDTDTATLRLSNGSTAGGISFSGSAPASSLVNGGYTVTLQSDGSLLIPAGDADNTGKGQIFSDNESSFINLDVQFSSDIIGGMRLGTDGPKPVDIVTNTNNSNHKWRFGADGVLTLPQVPPNNGNRNLSFIDAPADADLRLRTYGNGHASLRVISTISNNTRTLVDLDLDRVRISTNNDEADNGGTKDWLFAADGLLTFPGETGFQATFGSVAPIGDVLHSINDLVLKSDHGVTVVSGENTGALETVYNDQLTTLTNLLNAELYGTSFLPASHDSIIALAQAKALNPLISDQIITVATLVSDAWDAWQSALNTSGIDIGVGDHGWHFGSNGILTLPFGSTINDTPNAPGFGNGKAVEIKPGNVLNSNQLLRIYATVPNPDANHLHLTSGDLSITDLFLGDDNQFVKIAVDGKVCIGTYGTAGHFWQFGPDGSTTFPDGATILNSEITAAPEQYLNLYGGSTQEGQGQNIQLYGGDAGSTSTNSYEGGRVRFYAGHGVNGGIGGYIRFRTYGTGTTSYNLKLGSDGVVYLPYGSQIDFNAPYSRFKDAQNTGVQLGSPDDQNYVNVDNTAVTIQVNSDGVTGPHTLPQHNWVFGTSGSLALPNSNSLGRYSEIYTTNDGYQTIFETFAVKGQGQKLTLDYDAAEVKIQTQTGTEWTFGQNGSLTLPGAIVNANGIEMTTDRGTVQFGYNLEVPGLPQHFHINKSGSFDLFLGDDYNYVKLPAAGGVDISTLGSSRKTWQFGTDGNLTVPGTIKSSTISQVGYQFVFQTGIGGATNNNGASGVSLDQSALVDLIQAGWTAQFANYGPVAVTIVFDYDGLKYIGMGTSGFSANFPITFTSPDYAPVMILPLVIASGSSYWQFGPDGSLTLPSGAGFGLGESGQLKVNDTTTQSLDFRDATGRGFYTNGDGYALRSNGNNTWTFGTTGSITFPQGGTLRVGTVPAHSTGAVNDKAGTVAFANGYIYYCTADYAPTQYPALAALSDANGVDNGYLVPNSYQLPSVGWIIYYNNQTAVINQVNNGDNPGYYTVFTDTTLFIPADSIFLYGPPSSDIWKRVAWSGDTW